MIPARFPIQRPHDARLLLVNAAGDLTHVRRAHLADILRAGDLVVANDAATLPASLTGVHVPTGQAVEIRLAGRRTLDPEDVRGFVAVVFGEGDFRWRTEDRPPPPRLAPGDRLSFGDLTATVEALLGHSRLIRLVFEGSAGAVWGGIARRGVPIQYAHMARPLDLWDVWTPIAAVPVAFEAPSAGFVLDWTTLQAIQDRGVEFATITLAAGISSTGDPDLDRRLPLDEAYRIPAATAASVARARHDRARLVAIGTSVVRALEDAAWKSNGFVPWGAAVATQRIGPATVLQVVDAILTGTHEADSSHYQLLRAFVDDATLARASRELDRHAYRTHEFGDSMLIERSRADQEARLSFSWSAPAFEPAVSATGGSSDATVRSGQESSPRAMRNSR
jgi:S-adenosylmethionine:tRNA ribosyltransferase-isomerase